MRVVRVRSTVSKWRGSAGVAVDREESTAQETASKDTVAHMLYLDHIDRDGHKLFEKVCVLDLEGIVCKRKDSPYKVTETA